MSATATAPVTEDNAVSSLATFATLPGWLAAAMDGQRVADELGRQVPELSSGALRLQSCTPERLRAKGDEWLARYRLRVAPAEDAPASEPPAGQAGAEVVLVGRLWAPSQPAPRTHAPAGEIPLGEPGWGCWLPELRLELQAQASDEALPALPTLVDPLAATELLEPILHKAGYLSATITSCRPEVVRYKPGSRCTVVVGLTYDSGAPSPPRRARWCSRPTKETRGRPPGRP